MSFGFLLPSLFLVFSIVSLRVLYLKPSLTILNLWFTFLVFWGLWQMISRRQPYWTRAWLVSCTSIATLLTMNLHCFSWNPNHQTLLAVPSILHSVIHHLFYPYYSFLLTLLLFNFKLIHTIGPFCAWPFRLTDAYFSSNILNLYDALSDSGKRIAFFIDSFLFFISK